MRTIVLILCFISFAFGSYGYSLSSGWHFLGNGYSDTPKDKLTDDADIILTYRQNKWYGSSPSGLYTNELESLEIEPFDILQTGEGLWAYFSIRGSVTFMGNDQTKDVISLKQGWNFVSLFGKNSYIIPSYYFTLENGIESIWSYDDFNKEWNVFTQDESILTDISNDDNITYSDKIFKNQGQWVYALRDTNITIEDLPPEFDTNETINLDEQNMKDFLLQWFDPNGDPIEILITEDSDNMFEQNYLGIKFKPFYSIPKSSYTLKASLSTATANVEKTFIFHINKRYENDYNGELSQIVGDDPDLDKQWYLKSEYLNILSVHERYNGSSENAAVVQIVEGGFNTNHEDLIANVDFSMAYDSSELIDGQNGLEGNCTDINNSHGTAVAGIIGARGYNGVGIRGINPYGKITGHRFYFSNGLLYSNKLDAAWLNGPRANEIDISNNSWATCKDFSMTKDEYLKEGSRILRDGKGRIYVFAAGNHRIGYGNCTSHSANLVTMFNSPYSIVVASMGKDDKVADSSSPGANLFISAYGEDVIWTTYSNTLDYAGFGGTSAAAPMVSGGIALLLEACPDLNYRDVQNLLVKSAIVVDSGNDSWVENSVGIKHSNDYGFGKMNISGAIEMCQNNYIPKEQNQTIEVTQIIDTNLVSSGVNSFEIDINENIQIEWVGLFLDGNIDRLGEYQIELISPSGTKKQLVHGNNAIRGLNWNSNDFIKEHTLDEMFRVSSFGFYDEESLGRWRIEIEDKNSSSNQVNRLLRNMKLQLIGE
ncbi:MAG TPA: hypothetical protein ENK66_04190 [Arcobacter sp.]|jgi:subtilisin family serine protease/subtilisin-like proprotein convertase family protein|nr:hypothetical protein [Arcobacter sp.]